MRRTIFAVVALAILTPTFCAATTWYVKPDGTGDAPTIAAALDSVGAGDTVLVANGEYLEVGLSIGVGIVLRGESTNPDSVAIGKCVPYVPILTASGDSSTRIEGVSIVNGCGGGGNGARCYGDVRFDNCIFSGNFASTTGGAVHVVSGAPVFKGCQFIGNSASQGLGGAVFSRDTAPIFVDCVFRSNHAWQGGAIYGGVGGLTDCVFEGNYAGVPFLGGNFDGGAVNGDGDSLLVVGCTFLNNKALSGNDDAVGGAISLWATYLEIRNSTFYNNEANDGSALSIGGDTVVIRNTIIASNKTGPPVGCFSPNLVVECSNVFDNEVGDYTGCLSPLAGINGNISVDPRFCDPLAGDLTLASASECLPLYNNCGVLIGSQGLGCLNPPAGIDPMPISDQLSISSYPNPFNPSTSIEYHLPRDGVVTLEIYDVAGRRVTTLVNGPRPAGPNDVTWDGLNDARAGVASGVYFAVLRFDGITRTHKVILLE